MAVERNQSRESQRSSQTRAHTKWTDVALVDMLVKINGAEGDISLASLQINHGAFYQVLINHGLRRIFKDAGFEPPPLRKRRRNGR